jgi:plasmid replication initiation protein
MTKVVKDYLVRAAPQAALPVQEKSVSMSNALCRGVQALSLTEKRLIALAVAKTDSVNYRKLFDAQHVGWRIKLTAKEYLEAYEVDESEAYKQLRKSARSLLRKTWRVKIKDGVREGNYFSYIEYHDGAGTVIVQFTSEVAPHLLALRARFTTYKLKQASALRSVYSWRLFENLKSWESKRHWRVKVEDFNSIMDTPESIRQDFGNLRMRVIEPALKELRQKSGFIINCNYIKKGRKVSELEFSFEIDRQGKLDL